MEEKGKSKVIIITLVRPWRVGYANPDLGRLKVAVIPCARGRIGRNHYTTNTCLSHTGQPDRFDDVSDRFECTENKAGLSDCAGTGFRGFRTVYR